MAFNQHVRAAEPPRDGLRFFQIHAGQTRRNRRHGDSIVPQFLMRHDRQQGAIDAA
jgi:hypothetical protein